MKNQPTRTRYGIAGTHDVEEKLTLDCPKKRKSSVFDELREAPPTNAIVTIDASTVLPPLIMEALDGGDILRITGGDIRVQKMYFPY